MDEALMDEVRATLRSWRSTHPHATFAEIEQAVEEQIARIRARMLERVVADGPVQERVPCPACGATMVPRQRHRRELTVRGDQQVHLDRSYVVCPRCQRGLFPPG
jgi:YgiT-type zinc finger domain-containing protein